MLGDTAALGGGSGSGDAVAAPATVTHDGGAETTVVAVAAGGGSNSGDDERGERSSLGGNRWPRQETLALLRIRSDMDVAFRDASVKGPLWEDVSRKLAEVGYHRSAKKCKEKFENVYKYHKRTKEGRSGKPDGKSYRFFEQLEALDHQNQPRIQSPNPSSRPPQVVTTSAVPMPPVANTTPTTTSTVPLPHLTVPSTATSIIPQSMVNFTTSSINLTIPSNFPPSNPLSFPNIPTDLMSNSSSSSTSSDATLEEGRRKRKRKWKDLFERLMRQVIEKQEELQKRFLEAIEKREQERIAREEARRIQEMQRINKEREILAQERSIAAAKDAAVMQFLQKIAEQQNLGQPFTSIINIAQPQPQPQQQSQQQLQAAPQLTAPTAVQQVVVPLGPQQQQQVTNTEITNAENLMPGSSSRWPKVEVQALIKLRTSLDEKYQENGPKGPLWEEISAGMRKIGYNRSAKRCKEKWENINKYFKKVKESNKRRPEDSKTCPYFHQLDALYREKSNKLLAGPSSSAAVAPLMVRPEQQWPPQQPQENEPMERHHVEEEDLEEENELLDKDNGDGDEEEEEEEEEEEGEDEGGGNYEIVASKPPANSSVGASAE